MAGRFDGKVAVITGGAQGIGLATAHRFAQDGADIALVDLAGSPLAGAADAIRATGRRVLTVEADVTQADQVRRYAEAVEAEFGGAHYFFNNAGILGPVAEPIYSVVAVAALGGALRALGAEVDVAAGMAAAQACLDA